MSKQVKVPDIMAEFPDNPGLVAGMQSIQQGFKYGNYTPTLTNITAPPAGKLRGAYQLCGKVCHVAVILDYSGTATAMTITAGNSLTLPFKASSGTYGIVENPIPLVSSTAGTLIGFGLFDTSTGNRVTFSNRAGTNGEIMYLFGFYWVD